LSSFARCATQISRSINTQLYTPLTAEESEKRATFDKKRDAQWRLMTAAALKHMQALVHDSQLVSPPPSTAAKQNLSLKEAQMRTVFRDADRREWNKAFASPNAALVTSFLVLAAPTDQFPKVSVELAKLPQRLKSKGGDAVDDESSSATILVHSRLSKFPLSVQLRQSNGGKWNIVNWFNLLKVHVPRG
jgi:hypothetical protein